MKEYSSERIRNIAITGHGGTGKTILSDAILFTSGAVSRIGKVEDGSTVSDYRPDEIERQISINSTLLSTEFGETKFNVLDTPGFTDFIGDVLSSLHVVDCAFLLIKAAEGVEVGTELVWKHAEQHQVPICMVVNKMDNEHANFEATLGKLRARFGAGVMPMQIPIKHGPQFDTIIDLLAMKMYTIAQDGSGKSTVADIPADQIAAANAAREELIEKIAESSEDLMTSFFEHGTLTDEEILVGLRAAILSRSMYPVLATSATLNIGVSQLLDFAAACCPAPTDRGAVVGVKPDSEEQVTIPAQASGEPALFVFKTLSEAHVGELSLFRVYSGTLTPGVDLINQSNGKTERLNQMFSMRGKDRKEVKHLVAGDIGAVVKLKDTHTNNTLASRNIAVQLPNVSFPSPLISAAIKPRQKGEEDKISTGLHTMHEEDPSFSVKVESETHETIVLGQGEIHLDIMMKRLKQRFGVEVDLATPRIPYRETIRKNADVSYKHKKQTGGSGQYGEVYIRLEPRPRGEGYEFVDAIVGGVISGKFVPAVDKGIQEQMARGVVAGYQMVDVKVTLYDGSQHTVDSNEMAFKIAAQMAFKKAVADANPILLEPIYDLTVMVPDEFMGDVMGDISSHRGKIQGMDSQAPFQVIRARVPLSELHSYATRLRSMTQGRGIFTRAFSHYEEVPFEVQQKIVEEANLAKEQE